MIKIWKVSKTQKVLKIDFFKLNLAGNSFVQILTVFLVGSFTNCTFFDGYIKN